MSKKEKCNNALTYLVAQADKAGTSIVSDQRLDIEREAIENYIFTLEKQVETLKELLKAELVK